MNTVICPDCGHHLHHPNPGPCQWRNCPCRAISEAGNRGLRAFVRHLDNCDYGLDNPDPHADCSCGLDAALRRAAQST